MVFIMGKIGKYTPHYSVLAKRNDVQNVMFYSTGGSSEQGVEQAGGGSALLLEPFIAGSNMHPVVIRINGQWCKLVNA
jgi:hypothetical protein